jgi:hypothetical protein
MKRMSMKDSNQFFNAFVEFRVKKDIGKLTLESDNRQNDSKSSRTFSIKSRNNKKISWLD